MNYLVLFFIVVNLFHAGSALSLVSNDARAITKRVFEKNENLYDIFLVNYDEDFLFDEGREEADALFEMMLRQFQADWELPQKPLRFENIRAVCQKYNYTLQPYSPKLWRKFHRTHIPHYSLFAVFMDGEKGPQDFADELERLQQDRGFCIDNWAEMLSLLVCSDTSVNHNDFLLAIMGSSLLGEISFGDDETLAVLLTNNFPLIYIDEHYPNAFTLPKKTPGSNDLEIARILQRLYFSAANVTGYKGFFALTPQQLEKFNEAFQHAGYNKSLDKVMLDDKRGLRYTLSIWRVLEGGFSSPSLREEILRNFAQKKFELNPYLEFRHFAKDESGRDLSATKRLIHWEILAHFGNVSTPLLEKKIREYSGQNLEQDLLILEKVKNGSIWEEISSERQRLAHIIFTEPATVPVSDMSTQVERKSEAKQKAPTVKKKAGSKNKKKVTNKQLQSKNKTAKKEVAPAVEEKNEKPIIASNKPSTQPKNKKKSSKKSPRKQRSTLPRPKISSSLLAEGFPLVTPAAPQPPKKSLIKKTLEKAQIVKNVLTQGPIYLTRAHDQETVKKLNRRFAERANKVLSSEAIYARALHWRNERGMKEIIRATENEVSANLTWYSAVKNNFGDILGQANVVIADLEAYNIGENRNFLEAYQYIINEIEQLKINIAQVDALAYPHGNSQLWMPVSPDDRIALVIMANALTYQLIEQTEKIKNQLVNPLAEMLEQLHHQENSIDASETEL